MSKDNPHLEALLADEEALIVKLVWGVVLAATLGLGLMLTAQACAPVL